MNQFKLNWPSCRSPPKTRWVNEKSYETSRGNGTENSARRRWRRRRRRGFHKSPVPSAADAPAGRNEQRRLAQGPPQQSAVRTRDNNKLKHISLSAGLFSAFASFSSRLQGSGMDTGGSGKDPFMNR